jgi:hypothetical protein
MELLRKNWTWLGWRLSRRGADGVFLEKKFFEPPHPRENPAYSHVSNSIIHHPL